MKKKKKPTRRQRAAAVRRSEDVKTPSTRLRDYESVARLITPEPPAWLAEHLSRWSTLVWLRSAVMEVQPSRAEMREGLSAVEAAVATLRQALGDGPTRAFLDAGGDKKIAYHGIVDANLADLDARAQQARLGPDLATPDGKARSGRGPALTSGAVMPATLCAMIIVEAWKHFHGSYPSDRNKAAWEAAELFWTMGANQRKSWGANRLTAWRWPFEEAMSSEHDEQRAEIVRHLKEAEYSASRFAPGAGMGVDSNSSPDGPV